MEEKSLKNKTIENMDKFHSIFTEYVKALKQRSDKEKIKEFSELRKMPIEEVESSNIFYINDSSEMLLPKYLNMLEDFGVISNTNHKPIFHNRWIIPIYNSEGKVQNLVGYSPYADERYIYGTAKYYRRRETLYGLENLHLAYELGYAILTEGITDTIRVRSLGYKNCFAMCGTHKSEFIMTQLNRCKYGIIRIPDRDTAGKETKKHWITNRYITLNTNLKYKDSDEMAKDENNREWFKNYINACIDWLKQREHLGLKCPTIETTMM